MRITDLLSTQTIRLNGTATGKADAIEQMVALMQKGGNITDIGVYKAAVLAREEEGSTGIGEGVAIPHAKSNAVAAPGLAAMVLPAGVDFDAPDGTAAQLIFLIAAPNTEENVHLDVLARLSVLLIDEDFRASLVAAATPAEFLAAIDKAEAERFAEEDGAAAQNAAAAGKSVVAVTACPTGIAHTYMAAEALQKAADAMGVAIKVETDGSGGVKNALTMKDIAAADGVIVAADREVDMDRFDGKPIVVTKVGDGIHKPAELLEKVLSGKAPLYEASSSAAAQGAAMGETESLGRKVYKALMNGVSFMLPFVIGGGILIALSFLFDSANAGAADFGSGNAISAFLNSVGNLAFGMMFPILAGFIAMAIGDRPAFMVGMVGGLMAQSGISFQNIGLPADQWIPSGFFGALIAGFVAGLLMLGLRKLFNGLPAALEGTKPTLLYPVLGILLIALVMFFAINPPVGAFNTWLNNLLSSMGETSRIVLGLVLGAMMSIDFGGPLNKAAYVFGTASIATGQTHIMAAVMAGGMVPPLAIAIATLVFRSRFTKDERGTTITNFVMGASFITEGAIPFAASDPIRVIPACAIGAAVAGGLSMLFGCGSPAPHGGLFVVPVMDNPVWYIVAVLAGSLVGAVLLGVLKKPLPQNEKT